MDKKKISTEILTHNVISVASGVRKPVIRVYKHPKEAVTNSVRDQNNSEELPLIFPEDTTALLKDHNTKKLVNRKHSQLFNKIRNNERITKRETAKPKYIKDTDMKQTKPQVRAGSRVKSKSTDKRVSDFTDLHLRLESIGKELDSLQEDNPAKVVFRKQQSKATKQDHKQQSSAVKQDSELYTTHLPVYNAEYYTEGSKILNRSLPGDTSCQMLETRDIPNLTSKTGQKLLRENKAFKSDVKDSIRRIREELSTWKNTVVPKENTCICGTSEINLTESVLQSPLNMRSQLASSSDCKETSDDSVEKQVSNTDCNIQQQLSFFSAATWVVVF